MCTHAGLTDGGSNEKGLAEDSVTLTALLAEVPAEGLRIMGPMNRLDWGIVAFAAAGLIFLIVRVGFLCGPLLVKGRP